MDECFTRYQTDSPPYKKQDFVGGTWSLAVFKDSYKEITGPAYEKSRPK